MHHAWMETLNCKTWKQYLKWSTFWEVWIYATYTLIQNFLSAKCAYLYPDTVPLMSQNLIYS
jgi:hypothetical protein